MKSSSLLVLACLSSMPVFSQTLPDEINHAPYEARYRQISEQVSSAESVLSESERELAEAQKFIREMNAHISNLQERIRQSEAQINSHQRTLPELAREISNLNQESSRLQSEIRRHEVEEANLQARHRDTVREIRPLEEAVRRKEQRIRDIQNELAQHQRLEREAQSRFSRVQIELSSLEREVAEENARQRQLQSELRSIESKIAALQSTQSQLEAQVNALESKLNGEKAKLSALNNRVQDYQNELNQVRSSGGTPEQIKAAERKLSAATGTRDNTASEVRQLEGQLRSAETQVRANRGQIEDLKRDQSTLPSRISQSEARERQLTQARSAKAQELTRLQTDLQQTQRNLQNLETALASARTDIRQDEVNLMRHRQLAENLVRSIESLRVEISSLASKIRAKEQQRDQLARRARELEAAIPELQADIRRSESEISQGRRDLATAQSDENRLSQSISSQQSKLSQLRSEQSAAEAQMNQRISLYERYRSESVNLGSTQTGTATGLGESEGVRLSQVISSRNGQAVGAELGLSEAKLWGFVRGEVQGYEKGLAEGLASPADQERGRIEGADKGKKDAHLFAQVNFRPVFFEEFVLEEFKRPLQKGLNLKSMKKIHLAHFNELSNDFVEPVSLDEIKRSNEIKTPLDEVIKKYMLDVKALEGKAARLSQAEVAFEEPTKIPLDKPDCSKVYKGLSVFKTACEDSYRGTFSYYYVEGARQGFGLGYTVSYERELQSQRTATQDSSYEGELNSALKVGHAEGLKIGKEEIYQKVFKATYSASYQSELPLAREKAKSDAKADLQQFLTEKPLLTLAGNKLEAADLRGGEEVQVTTQVKNVSQVALSSPALVRITHVENAEIISGEAVLGAAAPLSVTSMPNLKIKILASAKAGEKVIVKGIVDLPGDRYKGQRQETFELHEVLAANPGNNLKLDYAKFPDIKGVFRRKIHYLSATISPKHEDLPQGYELSLVATGETAGLIELNETGLKTGSLKVGAEKEINFSYTFLNAAKNKTINLELGIIFNGKVIKKELIVLIPN